MTSPSQSEPERKRRSRRGQAVPFQRKDGRWQVWVEMPSAGTRDRFPVYGSSPAEVNAKSAAIKAALAAGQSRPDRRTSIEKYVTTWLDARRPDSGRRDIKLLSPKSWTEYDRQARLHIYPHLGRRAIGDLKRGEVQRWLRTLSDKGCGERTIQFAHAVLRKALADARQLEIIPINVAENPDISLPKRDIPEPWEEHHAKAFLTGIAKDPDRALYLIAATCGLRPSETLALTWDSIDLERRVIFVSGSLTEWQGERFIKEGGKSDSARRTLPIAQVVADALAAHKVAQDEQRVKWAVGTRTWKDNNLVFPARDGAPRRRDSLSKQFAVKIAALGLPHIRLYDLRRLAITLVILETGNLHIARVFAGHSSIQLTSDDYGYLLSSVGQTAADNVAERIAAQALDDALGVTLGVNDAPDVEEEAS